MTAQPEPAAQARMKNRTHNPKKTKDVILAPELLLFMLYILPKKYIWTR
jgi:hypothetical protein